jgi:hypothetical protein
MRKSFTSGRSWNGIMKYTLEDIRQADKDMEGLSELATKNLDESGEMRPYGTFGG